MEDNPAVSVSERNTMRHQMLLGVKSLSKRGFLIQVRLSISGQVIAPKWIAAHESYRGAPYFQGRGTISARANANRR
jgi:hypothetical protein